EALVKRGDPYMHRYNVGGKYLVDVVQSDKPMIYITQSGQPRIVLFGEDLAIERPATIQAWSNRIMLKADIGDDEVEVYYRPEGALQGSVVRVAPTLSSFARFLGHTTSIEEPGPGLGLSYGEAVGVLHQIWSQRYIKADFKADQDRILAAIMRQADEQNVPDRPEFSTTEGNDDQLGGGSITGSVSDLGRLAPPMAEPPGGWLSHPDEIASPQANWQELEPSPRRGGSGGRYFCRSAGCNGGGNRLQSHFVVLLPARHEVQPFDIYTLRQGFFHRLMRINIRFKE